MVNKSFWEFFSNTPGLICHNCDLGCLSFIDFCDNAQLSSMVLTNRWTPAVCIHPPALLRLSPLFIFYSISGDLANSLDKGSWSRMSWGIFCAKQEDFTCVEEQWADQMCSDIVKKNSNNKNSLAVTLWFKPSKNSTYCENRMTDNEIKHASIGTVY